METICKQFEPLVVLDEKGKSLVFDYNLPQTNTHDLFSYIELKYPLETTVASDTGEGSSTPTGEFPPDSLPTDILKLPKNLAGFADWLFREAKSPSMQTLKFFPGIKKVLHPNFLNNRINNKLISIPFNQAKDRYSKADEKEKAQLRNTIFIVNKGLDTLYKDLQAGKIVDIVEDNKEKLVYVVTKPASPKYKATGVQKDNPKILYDAEINFFVKFHYRMYTYPGKTGLGKVVKTISLLPEETLEIFTSNYLSSEISRIESENIIDSNSATCDNTMQKQLSEQTLSSLEESSSASNYSNEFEGKVKGSGFTIGVYSKGSASASGSFSSSSESFGTVASEQVSNFSDIITSSTDSSNHSRIYEVTAETYELEKSESLHTIKRTLKNINRTHTLNYVFRQLVQEYVSLIYLYDVTILVPKNSKQLRPIKINELPAYLKSLGVQTKQNAEITADLLQQLSNIVDYDGETHSIIEVVPIELKELKVKDLFGDSQFTNSIGNLKSSQSILESKKLFYKRIKKGLKTTYENVEVPGIIINAKKRTLNTSSAVVDSILGPGHALDCWNRKLREANLNTILLNNRKDEMALEIIEAINDPLQKAEFYSKFFQKPDSEEDDD